MKNKFLNLRAMLLLAVLLCGGTAVFADTTVWRGDINYYLYDDLTAKVYGANKDITTANIPDKITYGGKDYTVTCIGRGAFDECSRLSSVDIPNSVTSIYGDAFSYCSRLSSVVIPSSVTYIGEYAFENCRSLAYVDIPNSVTYIGEYAFRVCRLSSVTIPNSVTTINEGTFNGCRSLVSVDIPSSVRYINGWAFDGCSSLSSVVIPSSVRYIGEHAFRGCYLASVVIPSSVTSIRDYTFGGCGSLSSVVIPSSVTSIGYHAFKDCSLTKLVCNATTPPACDNEVFEGVDLDRCTLIVPQESLDAYKSAAQWKSFFNITTGIKNVPNTSSSATESARYSTDGTRLASPQKGINIIRMSDGTVKKVLVK